MFKPFNHNYALVWSLPKFKINKMINNFINNLKIHSFKFWKIKKMIYNKVKIPKNY